MPVVIVLLCSYSQMLGCHADSCMCLCSNKRDVITHSPPSGLDTNNQYKAPLNGFPPNKESYLPQDSGNKISNGSVVDSPKLTLYPPSSSTYKDFTRTKLRVIFFNDWVSVNSLYHINAHCKGLKLKRLLLKTRWFTSLILYKVFV